MAALKYFIWKVSYGRREGARRILERSWLHLRGLLKQAFHLSLMRRLLTLNLSLLFFRVWNRAPEAPSMLPWPQKPPLRCSLRLGAQLFTRNLSWGSVGSYNCGLHPELRASPGQAAHCECTCRVRLIFLECFLYQQVMWPMSCSSLDSPISHMRKLSRVNRLAESPRISQWYSQNLNSCLFPQ